MEIIHELETILSLSNDREALLCNALLQALSKNIESEQQVELVPRAISTDDLELDSFASIAGAPTDPFKAHLVDEEYQDFRAFFADIICPGAKFQKEKAFAGKPPIVVTIAKVDDTHIWFDKDFRVSGFSGSNKKKPFTQEFVEAMEREFEAL